MSSSVVIVLSRARMDGYHHGYHNNYEPHISPHHTTPHHTTPPPPPPWITHRQHLVDVLVGERNILLGTLDFQVHRADLLLLAKVPEICGDTRDERENRLQS